MKGAGSARRSTRVRPQVVWSLVHKWVVWSGRVSKVVGVIRIVVWVLLLTIGDRHAAPIVRIGGAARVTVSVRRSTGRVRLHLFLLYSGWLELNLITLVDGICRALAAAGGQNVMRAKRGRSKKLKNGV